MSCQEKEEFQMQLKPVAKVSPSLKGKNAKVHELHIH
jgi:hypothetical protein